MDIRIGIAAKNRNMIIEILSKTLADEYLLYTKTRNYHWNVVGSDFSELHKFFESQYEELDDIIDEVAERARSLGGRSLGTLKEFLSHTRLNETIDVPPAKRMIGNLLADHEALIVSLRKDQQTCADLGDAGTCDFLTGLMEQHEKMAWMLRSFLE